MSEKMNVLFIITDQQRADHLGGAGNPDLKTPNLDRLAAEGMRFTNAYVANPICMPNRSTIFTGKYPSIHGTRFNGINLNPQIETFPQALLKNGYHTCSIGKIHLNFYGGPIKRKYKSAESMITFFYNDRDKRPPFPKPYYGLDEVHLTVGHGDNVAGHYLDWLEEKSPECFKFLKKRGITIYDDVFFDTPIPEEFYQTSYVTDRTITFLKKYSEGYYGSKPFFMHCSFPDPHHPVTPPGNYRKLYNPDKIKLPPTMNDIKSLYDHNVLGTYTDVYRTNFLRVPTPEEFRKFLAYTYGTLSMMDHGVGQILAALKSFGLENNTLVIFTSDHGDFMGDHGVMLKGIAHYQGVIKVPLIWKVPGITKTGAISDSLVSSIDIPSTVLNLLNIKEKYHPPGMQGVDISPILINPETKIRNNCIIEEDEDFESIPAKIPPHRARTMITDDYRITVYYGHEDTGDLYDLKNDPNELNNLWHDTNSREIRNKLLTKLLHEIININEHTERQARA